ncbi:GntR family transcriptional regulator [Bacillus amyloliquefaciens]|nr:GntR family transcriptional regulator [Bacillus amyloliquefaciens]
MYSPFRENCRLELCETYNVSRIITVRKAILDLVEEGWLVRQQGKGTFVKSPKLKRELIAVNGYSEFMNQQEKNRNTKSFPMKSLKRLNPSPKSFASLLKVPFLN